MLLDGNFRPEDFREPPPPDDDLYVSRPVLSAFSRHPRKPYPYNVYFGDTSWSGIAGTVEDGQLRLLDLDCVGLREWAKMPPRRTRYWDDRLADFVEGELTWDGIVAGSIDPEDDQQPARRLWDGSITGEWPNHPPRPERIVNPDKAREAYAEAKKDRNEWN